MGKEIGFVFLGEREEYRDRRFSVKRARLKTPAGAEVEWAYQETKPGVVVVAVNAAGQLAVKREWRLGRRDFVWELPSGFVDGEGAGAVAKAAAEELGQEAGVAAGRMELVGKFFLSNSATTLFHVFLARDIREAPLAPDEHEHVEVKWLPFAEAEALLLASQVPNAQTVVALNFAKPLL